MVGDLHKAIAGSTPLRQPSLSRRTPLRAITPSLPPLANLKRQMVSLNPNKELSVRKYREETVTW